MRVRPSLAQNKREKRELCADKMGRSARALSSSARERAAKHRQLPDKIADTFAKLEPLRFVCLPRPSVRVRPRCDDQIDGANAVLLPHESIMREREGEGGCVKFHRSHKSQKDTGVLN